MWTVNDGAAGAGIGSAPRGDPLPAGKCAAERAKDEDPSAAQQAARESVAHPGHPYRERGREHPDPYRHERDEPNLAEGTVGGLAPQLSAQRLFRALPFGVEMRAFEIHPRAVAIERLLQRGDDDAGEARFDLPERRRRRHTALGSSRRVPLQPTRHLRQPRDRVEDAHPLVEPHD